MRPPRNAGRRAICKKLPTAQLRIKQALVPLECESYARELENRPLKRLSQEIIYREKRWRAFLADPEWDAVVARTEKDGQLVEDISSQLLILGRVFCRKVKLRMRA
jgi:hypothetical protein